jgi:hypothetical protein
MVATSDDNVWPLILIALGRESGMMRLCVKEALGIELFEILMSRY